MLVPSRRYYYFAHNCNNVCLCVGAYLHSQRKWAAVRASICRHWLRLRMQFECIRELPLRRAIHLSQFSNLASCPAVFMFVVFFLLPVKHTSQISAACWMAIRDRDRDTDRDWELSLHSLRCQLALFMPTQLTGLLTSVYIRARTHAHSHSLIVNLWRAQTHTHTLSRRANKIWISNWRFNKCQLTCCKRHAPRMPHAEKNI